ncbi:MULTISPECIES: hypothetical protein [unclassified Mesorhizobium]|uniref:hypothetical protein n=1 Tax=unclassified Mesorhizobium TaxID=325217 RepID=UPI00333B8034
MDYIEQQIAAPVEGAARATVIRSGLRLLDRIAEHGVGIDDLDEHPHGETIVLKRVKLVSTRYSARTGLAPRSAAFSRCGNVYAAA